MEVSTRAYSLLDIKQVDDEKRILEGIASTPETDRQGDQILSEGAEFKLPLPLLWQHDSRSPIGNVTEAKVSKKGIVIKAQIAAAGVSAEIDKAWALIKAKLVRGLSIGFRALDTEDIPNSWGTIFKRWELLEISAVTIAANSAATITNVKQFDVGLPADEQAALGNTLIARLEGRVDDFEAKFKTTTPAALGTKPVRLLPPGGSGLHKPNPKLRIITT